MNLGICIGTLDETLGPIPIYFKNLPQDLAKKIIMKVMIGVMSFSAETNEDSLTGESIIPFIKEGLITFAYMFPIKDPKARNSLRQCSIVLAFNSKDRKKLYENANALSKIVKNLHDEIKLIYIQKKDIPMEVAEKFDLIPSQVFTDILTEDKKEKSQLLVTCPQCSTSKEIEFPLKVKGIKLIEHNLDKGEVCEHSFTIYLDSKFNILGYKDPEVELKDLKKIIGKLKSPYD